MENKKLTKEELDQIKEIQTQNQSIVVELGNLEVAKIQIENRYDELVEFYNQMKVKEQDLGKQLSDKYGDGTIDIEKEEFISK